MDSVEKIFRILLGLHVERGVPIQPGINTNGWNLELQETTQGFCLTVHSAQDNLAKINIEDLELLSNLFFTKNINIGNLNKVHAGCKTCNAGADYQLPIWINNPGHRPPVTKHFLFGFLRGESLNQDDAYYNLSSSRIREQSLKALGEFRESLLMV